MGRWMGRTFVLHESADFLPSPEIPDFDDLVSAPSRKPFATLRRRSNRFDIRDMGGENEDRLQRPFELRGWIRRRGRRGSLKTVEEALVRSCDNFEGGW